MNIDKVKLTDEQREEIQKFMTDTMFDFCTTEALFNRIARARRLINLLLASEQAWKEENEKLKETLTLYHGSQKTLTRDVVELEQQLNQAIELLRKLLDDYTDRAQRLDARIVERVCDFLSSQEKARAEQ